MAEQQVKVPDIGGAEGAEVIELLVAVGDTVAVDQSLLVLESDKASMEIPSSLAGTVKEILVKVGDELAEGSPIAVIEVDGAAQDVAGAADAGAGEKDSDDSKAAASKSAAAAKQAEAGARDGKQTSAPAGTKQETETASDSDGSSREVTVEIPDIGTDEAVDLIELCIQVGDEVGEGDSLVVLESDKASMEVPAPQAGRLVKWLVKAGATVRQGDPLAIFDVAGGGAAAQSGKAASASASQDPSATAGKGQEDAGGQAASGGDSGASEAAPQRSAQASSPGAGGGAATGGSTVAARADGELAYAGPAVRKLAREFGVDIAQVVGTGPRDRILKEDVQAYVQRALNNRGAEAAAVASGAGIPPIPEVDYSAFGEVESVPRTKMDKLTAANMHRSWLNVPHVTQWDDADITELEAFRASLKGEAEKRGTRLTPVPFLLKACAIALRDNPKFNASLSADGENLVYKHYFHIGMAVDTPAGLVVPVIRDVDQKSLWELAEEVIDLAARARDRKLKPQEMQGGCFSISSLGSIGGRGFTPIVNAPEVGILGVSRAGVQPVWDGQAFQPRTMLPLALSYDHRVVNGADAGRFLTQLAELLGDIRRLLL